MLAAGIVEYARLSLYRKGRVLPHKFHDTQIVSLSVFWQIPQYLLVGLSEVKPTHGFSQTFSITLALCRSKAEKAG